MVHLFYVSLFDGLLILRFYLMVHLFYVSLFDGSLILRFFI